MSVKGSKTEKAGEQTGVQDTPQHQVSLAACSSSPIPKKYCKEQPPEGERRQNLSAGSPVSH